MHRRGVRLDGGGGYAHQGLQAGRDVRAAGRRTGRRYAPRARSCRQAHLLQAEACCRLEGRVLVKTWLEEKAYYDYYLAAQDFAEDNDLFIEGRNAIQGYLGVSDEYIESILSKCVAD